jgi:hypothetical protein
MKIKTLQSLLLGGIAAAALLLVGCASQPTPPVASTPTAAHSPTPALATAPIAEPAQAAVTVTYFAVLPEDERYYLFGDTKTYLAYLEHGEVALTRTRIGASPTQTSVVFGLTDNDVKSGKPSAPEALFDGKATSTSPFYGEVFKDGRFYVFNEFKDMKTFLEHGEAALTFTDIGTGPKGATQVWVLNNDTMKKGRPVETMAMFKSIRTAK